MKIYSYIHESEINVAIRKKKYIARAINCKQLTFAFQFNESHSRNIIQFRSKLVIQNRRYIT